MATILVVDKGYKGPVPATPNLQRASVASSTAWRRWPDREPRPP